MQAWPIPVFTEDYSAIMKPVQAQCALQRCVCLTLSRPLGVCRNQLSHGLLLQRKSRRTDEQDAPHSANTPLQVLSLTGSLRLGAETPALPSAARGSTPATAVQMELQPSSELAEVHTLPHAVSGSLAQTSVPPMNAPAQPFAQQASADLSSEQASAGNNAASMQTSSVPTQHAQVLPATAAPQNGHQDDDDMVGIKVAMFCLELTSQLYTSLSMQLLTV